MLRSYIITRSGEDDGDYKRLKAVYGGNEYMFNPTSEFWGLYLSECSKNADLNIVEKIPVNLPRKLAININVDFSEECDNSKIGDELDKLIENAIPLVNEAVHDNIDVSDSKIETTCIYLRRDNAVINNKFRGRLVFPFIRGTSEQLKEIGTSINKIMRKTYKNQIIAQCSGDALTAYRNMFRVYDKDMVLLGCKEGPMPLNHVKAFFDGEFDDFPEFEENLFPFNADVEGMETIPLILTSWYGFNMKCKWISDEDDEMPEEEDAAADDEYLSPSEIDERNLQEEFLSLITIISDKRGQNFHDWLDIGSAFSTINNGLKHWKDFTKRCGTFSEEECDFWWSDHPDAQAFRETKNTIRTLRFFAISDNRKMYMNFIKPEIGTALTKMIERGTSGTIADLFYLHFPCEFICSKYESNEWWFFGDRSHAWKTCNYELDKYLMDHFKPIVETIFDEYKIKLASVIEEDERKVVFQQVKNLEKVVKYLEEPAKKSNLKKELRTKYFYENFDVYSDELKYYTVFKNCVIDTRNGEAVPRPGKPEDFITRIPKTPYLHDLTEDSLEVKEARKYIMEIFRNNEVVEFMLTVFASFLVVGNLHKRMFIFSGGGNNSKSALQNVFKNMLGDQRGYFSSPSSTILTEKRSHSNSAAAGIIGSTGTRAAFLQELDKGAVLNTGYIKTLTGGDNVKNRDLFQRAKEVVAKITTWIPILCTNHPIVSHDINEAIWNRILLIEFNSRWSNGKTIPVPETYEEQMRQGIFPMDPEFETRKAPMIAKGLLWLMCKYYAKYAKEGENVPQVILDATHNLRKRNNPFYGFVDELLEKVDDDVGDDEPNSINIIEAFRLYRTFVATNNLNVSDFDINDFTDYVSEIIGVDAEDGCWFGWIINEDRKNAIYGE